MKKLLCVLMFGMMFGQTKLETRLFEVEYSSLLNAFPETSSNMKYINLSNLVGIDGRYIVNPFLIS